MQRQHLCGFKILTKLLTGYKCKVKLFDANDLTFNVLYNS